MDEEEAAKEGGRGKNVKGRKRKKDSVRKKKTGKGVNEKESNK